MISQNIAIVCTPASERYGRLTEQKRSLNTIVDMFGSVAKKLGKQNTTATVYHLLYTMLHINYFPYIKMRRSVDNRVAQCTIWQISAVLGWLMLQSYRVSSLLN